MPDRVSAVVLAAGSSERFADGSKQLVSIAGESAVRRIVKVALGANCAETIVVTGCDREAVGRELHGLEVVVVHNGEYETGQASSVRSGLAAVSEESDGALFLPCDQPFLELGTVELVIRTWLRGGGIVVPVFEGRRGAPVLFSRPFFEELAGISGDQGGRQILARHSEAVVEVELPSRAALDDFDSVEELSALVPRRLLRPGS